MTETTSPVVAQATDTAMAQSGIPKDITGAEALAMVQAEKAAKAASAVPKTAPTTAQPPKEDPKAGVTSDAAKEAMRKYKLKVDGEEIEVDEDELKRGYSHRKAASKVYQEGVLARKQAEEFISMMKDPQKFYETAKKLGHDPRKLAEEYLVRELEDELMDPKEKELKTTKAKLEEYEAEKQRQKEAEEKQRNEALKAKYQQEYSEQFVDALKNIDLPPTKEMVAKMARYIARAAQLKFKMTPHEAAQLVKEDDLLEKRSIIRSLKGEEVIKYLGEDTINEVRKYDTSRIKNPEQNLRTPIEQGKPRERGVANKRMSAKEWREYNRR